MGVNRLCFPICFFPDVDECQPFKNNCHFDAECLNTEGSFECRCRPGYQGDGLNCTCKLLWYMCTRSETSYLVDSHLL